MVVEMERFGATEAIPPVVARILSGDSTSPLTREARGIVLFVGQHFSGSLFELIHLLILTRERTKETRCKSEPRLRKARALR